MRTRERAEYFAPTTSDPIDALHVLADACRATALAHSARRIRDDLESNRLFVSVVGSSRVVARVRKHITGLSRVRAPTIMGEATGGCAHPTHSVPLEGYFVLMVPSARPINAVTKPDWEGTGVQPDVKVPAGQALDKAKQLATDKVAKLRATHK